METVLSIFAYHPYEALNYKQVTAALKIKDTPSRELVKEMIDNLQKTGAIKASRRGKFKLNPDYIGPDITHSILEGKVDMKQTGKAYVICDELEEDVYVSATNTGQALHNDLVKVRLFPKRKGRKLEGLITEVIKRAKTEFVGTIELSKDFAFLVPDLKNMPYDLYIPKGKTLGAKNGEKAVAKITDWPTHLNNPIGEVTKILGLPGDNEVEMNSILSEFDFPLTFPDKVIREAKKISIKIPASEIKRRKDFRQVYTCTIDPEDAKDFDDALSIRPLKNNHWEIGIHIADVSHYVKPDSALDAEAYKRGTSVYLVDRVVPMLPETLSNVVCSLRPDEDKLTFSAVFEMDETGAVYQEWFGKTIIRSNRRFTYEQVQEVIETGTGTDSENLLALHRTAQNLRQKRFDNGAINFKSTEVKFIVDENGKPLGAKIKEQKASHQLIEEFMLLANRKTAERMGRRRGKSKPRTFVYRIHDEPSPEKLTQFSEFVNRIGYNINTQSRKGLSKTFNQLFDQIAGKGEENMIEKIAIRTMAKAEYSTQNIGHYGLAFKYYTHFTSPIRRYPDLLVHRLFEAYLDKKPDVNPAAYEDMCIHASEMERKAIDAERASVKYKQVEYMADKVGEVFDGLISGVSKWGLFVELNESKAEGLVAMGDLNDDFYILDEDNYRIIGKKYRNTYSLGDPIRVLVKRINLAKKQMDFEIV